VVGRQRGHQLAGALPQRTLAGARLDVVIDCEHASEHARDVAVDERRAFTVCDRCDRTRGVRTDARHLAQLARTRWQRAGERLCHRLRPSVEVARARVVAEAGPRSEHVIEPRGGERAHRRKLRHPALPVRDHGLDARLLQHDLADPDRVRIARATPGQVAAVTPVVRDDSGRDLNEIHRVVVARSRRGDIEQRSSCRGGSSRSPAARRSGRAGSTPRSARRPPCRPAACSSSTARAGS
jgi:hypothetical protein